MAKSKKKSETVFLVCKESSDHNYYPEAKVGRREADAARNTARRAGNIPSTTRRRSNMSAWGRFPICLFRQVGNVPHVAPGCQRRIAPMAKRWHIRSHDSASIAALQRAAGVPDVVAQLLICRGITDPAKVRSFLDPKLTDLYDPELLPGCAAAARRIHAAVQARERIVIYGDYDVDGMTGTAILCLCLKLLGAEVSYYVPHRVDEGYGLNCEAVQVVGRRPRGADDHRRLRHQRRRRGGGRPAMRARTDHHRSPHDRPATARRGGDRPSATGRHVSLRRAERLGRGLQTGLGALPAGQRCAEGQPADAGLPRAGGRPGGPGHRGRRRAAGRREPRAGASRAGEPRPMSDARPGHADEDRQDRAQDATATARRGWTARTSALRWRRG